MRASKQFIIAVIVIFHLAEICAKPLELKSPEQQVHLVELYSSEGCSSCPPADRWLASLTKNKALWKSFIPIEFHVDYWDKLGWVDPFGNKSFSKRQRNYSQQWGVHKVATPGFVLDGKHWPLGRQQKELPNKLGPKVGVLKVTSQGKQKFQIEFEPKKNTKMQYDVYGALLGHGLKTEVPRGENSGETLKHEFVVLSMSQRPLFLKNKKYSAVLSIADNVTKVRSHSLVFWVTERNRLNPIQVVGAPIVKKDIF